jgi:cytosine/adenosine deaminase-related metal-dependent hydrolase
MRALGWQAGELKPGMLADFVTLDQTDRTIDLAYLIFVCSASDVVNVVVGGRTLVSA